MTVVITCRRMLPAAVPTAAIAATDTGLEADQPSIRFSHSSCFEMVKHTG